MRMELKFAWLVFSIILVLIWGSIFIVRSDLRREMLWTSFTFLPLALSAPLFAGSYWDPKYFVKLFGLNIGIADFLYTFAIGGIGSVSYQFFLDKHYSDNPDTINWYRALSLALVAFCGVAVFIFLEYQTMLHINPILTSAFGMLVCTVFLIWLYPAQMNPIILNGILFGLVVVIAEIVTTIFFPDFFSFWIEDKLLGLRILGAPVEEFVWHFAWGAAVGAVFEISRAVRDI